MIDGLLQPHLKNATDCEGLTLIHESSFKDELNFIVSGNPMFDNQSNITPDVICTEQVENEKKIFCNEEQLKILLENIPSGIFVNYQDGRVIQLNEVARNAVNNPDELKVLGDSYKNIKYTKIDGQPLPLEETPSYRALKGEVVKNEMIIAVRPDKIAILEISSSPVYDNQGNILMSITSANDVTEFVNQKREIERQKEQLEAIIENMSDGLSIFDKDGKYILFNKVSRDMFFPTYEYMNKSGDGYYQAKYYDTYGNPISAENIPSRRVMNGESFSAMRMSVEFTDKTLHLETSGTPLYDSEGNFLMGILCSRDVTEVINYEEKLKLKNEQILQDILEKSALEKELFKSKEEAQKNRMEKEIARLDGLSLVGEMAAGIGHEVRNPMTTVRGFLQLLSTKEECSKYNDYFSLMIDELDRANSIITEFLSLAKDRVVEYKMQSLKEIVENIFPLIQADGLVSDKYIQMDIEEVPKLPLDKKEINQLILNLVLNGSQAMSPGGTMKIKTFMDNKEIVLAVQDDGGGIAPEVLEKIGTPFFTTKENGTGLGLAVCYSVAARHNAKIDIETGSTGTTFFVRFRSK